MANQPAHLPKLTPDQLKALIAHLDSSKLSRRGKGNIASMMAQASADGDSIQAAIKSLPEERQAHVADIEADIGALTTSVVTRGSAGLEAMSEAEWLALVNEANKEQP